MVALLATLRRRALDVPLPRALAAVDGFPARGGSRRPWIERIVAGFLRGYERALAQRDPERLALALEGEPAIDRGFAHEGAGMGLALVDALAPRACSKLLRFARGAGDAHRYMILVGAGWANARLGFARARARRRLLADEPLFGGLALDGEGFHDGFFHAREVIVGGTRAPGLAEQERPAYDQGVGRSLWFFHAADRARIPETLARFAPERQGEMWSGVGLACAYAGGEDETLVRALLEAAGEARAHFAQGVAFAVEARTRAGNMTPHTAAVAQVVWGRSGGEIARTVARALEESGARAADGLPRYAAWRAAVRGRHEVRTDPEQERARVSAG